MPDLSQGSATNVWVRGYGLIDSPKIRQPSPGQGPQPEERWTAAEPPRARGQNNYPAIYWYSMLEVPEQERISPSPP